MNAMHATRWNCFNNWTSRSWSSRRLIKITLSNPISPPATLSLTTKKKMTRRSMISHSLNTRHRSKHGGNGSNCNDHTGGDQAESGAALSLFFTSLAARRAFRAACLPRWETSHRIREGAHYRAALAGMVQGDTRLWLPARITCKTDAFAE